MPSVWEVSDEALLAGYVSGDRAAASLFVQRFQRQMIGLARTMTSDAAEAEEVAQDAFVRAWRYAASYDGRRGSVRTWILSIVRNVALDRARVAYRRHETPADEVAQEARSASDDAFGDAVVEREDAVRVRAALDALPADQRDALVAVTLHGMTARELSEATAVPLGTVKTRIRLGLRKLRNRLDERIR